MYPIGYYHTLSNAEAHARSSMPLALPTFPHVHIPMHFPNATHHALPPMGGYHHYPLMNTPHFAMPPLIHPSIPTYPTFPIPPTHDSVHTPTLPSPFPDFAASSNQQYIAPPTLIYIKEDNALKLPTCPKDPKDFPTYEMKVRASLHKFNIHHLLDDYATTNDANKDISAKLASALLLSYKNKHIKWFMGSDLKQYEER